MKYEITEELLTINEYSRPGTKLRENVKGIVIHWVANPKVPAINIKKYFEKKQNGKTGYGSAHYIIDSDLTLRCIPENEVAYHCGTTTPINNNSNQVYTDLARSHFGKYCMNPKRLSPNSVTLGIELCHEDWEGKLSKETWSRAVWLCVELCLRHNLDPLTDIFTHHDIVGWKDCPKWFVYHDEDFIKFRKEIDINLQAIVQSTINKSYLDNF